MADLSLQNLTKTYPGGTVAVEGASIDVADGEFIVMVGPSGCGKSTTLRMIAGLERITTGRLEIAGREVNNVEPGERDIAMVFQNYALYPHMTVYRNMSYGLRNEGLPKPEIETRINEAAEMLQLTQLLDRKPRQLSGGQRQRVAMGRAIVRHPAVFLFDEPLSNLDAKLRTQLRAELKSLHARLGATFVYVTHDQVEAMSLADRIVVMNEGKIEQIGAPMELYHAPASRFVAEFIGSPAMNMIDGEISTDGLAMMADGTVLANFSTPQQRAGEKVVLGIRPEHLIPGAVGGVSVNLSSVLEEQLGADTLLHCALGGQTITLRRNGSEPALTGDFTAGATEFHLFDQDT